MGQITPFTAKVKASLREDLLDSATRLLSERGFQGLRMADVAAETGVSRQTVYNEFGNKEALAQAVALRVTADFLDGTAAALDEAPDFLDGAHRAVRHILDRSLRDPLVSSILTGTGAEDMLPFLTIKGDPVLRAATELVSRHLRGRLPEVPEDTADLYAETTVRLTLSHLLLPSGTVAEAAGAVTAIARVLLTPYLSTAKERS
ncbi:TetR/AcrR family transcriptional regulator [Allokutzneria albata]|uniref:DNA-binding transcriptional regulator, AcrR family n=1 Tax=Allokutzneria albata TaxID=211114 RepID=A0A1H0AXM9_ALLAB|nr:TetR family transcriptional regulator [Allokutzneria albata]SDN38185.1 DNA-binding transcriptional regulator, AcrR family [Allokutzneria albata]